MASQSQYFDYIAKKEAELYNNNSFKLGSIRNLLVLFIDFGVCFQKLFYRLQLCIAFCTRHSPKLGRSTSKQGAYFFSVTQGFGTASSDKVYCDPKDFERGQCQNQNRYSSVSIFPREKSVLDTCELTRDKSSIIYRVEFPIYKFLSLSFTKAKKWTYKWYKHFHL